LQRQDVATHVKTSCPLQIVKCQYCNAEGKRQFIEDKHMGLCFNLPLPCPNNCEIGSVPRNCMEDHIKVCRLEPIQCEYHIVGCKTKISRKDQKKHNKNNIEEHLSLITLQVTSTKLTMISNSAEALNSKKDICSKIAQTENNLAATKEKLTSAQDTTDKKVVWIINEFKEIKKQLATKKELAVTQLACKDDLSLKVEQVRQETVGITEQLRVADRDLHTKLQQTQGELDQTRKELGVTNEKLKATQKELKDANEKLLQGLNTCNQNLKALKQQLNTTQETLSSTQSELSNTKAMLRVTEQTTQTTKNELRSTQTELANTKETLKATQQNAQKTKDYLSQSLVDTEMLLKRNISDVEIKLQQQDKTRQIDCIKFNKWYKSIYTMATKVSSGDLVAPVVVTMPEYSQKRKEQTDWYSGSFYTHHKGYRLCVNVCITPPYMSVGLLLMKGPHDEKLKWPMKGYCEVKLLNQISNSEHYTKVCVDTLSNGRKRVIRGERSTYHVWSMTTFVTDDELQKITTTCQYLKDDSVFIQIDYKPHT